MNMISVYVSKIAGHVKYPDISSEADRVETEVEDFINVQEKRYYKVVLQVVKPTLGYHHADRLITVFLRTQVLKRYII